MRPLWTNRESELGVEVECRFGPDSARFSSAGEFVGTAEASLAVALLPAMSTGASLRIDAGISARLLSHLPTIQEIYRTWDRRMRTVALPGVSPVAGAKPSGTRIGSFFSGGVDSFYTFLKHRDEITDLLFVHGFDVRLDNTLLRKRASEKVQEVAADLGVRVVEIETDLRSMLDRYVDWGLFGHGAALFAVGHLLSSLFTRIYIPASHTYADLIPGGSHPLVDPLWSSEALEFVHDGCEATRVEKVATLAEHDLALRSLRVCWRNVEGAYNCGRCEKCLRTMINLKAVGALDRCSTFDAPFDPRRVAALQVDDPITRAYVQENLQGLEERGVEPELQRILRRLVRCTPGSRTPRQRVTRLLRRPLVHRLLRRVRRVGGD